MVTSVVVSTQRDNFADLGAEPCTRIRVPAARVSSQVLPSS